MSQKPILYMHIYSPPARAVMLTAAALGVEFELKPVDLLGLEHRKPEFLKVSHVCIVIELRRIDTEFDLIFDSSVQILVDF